MKYYHFILGLFIMNLAFAQEELDEQIPKKQVYTADIVDNVYGITLYEPLNMVLSGDSSRMISGYAADQWVEDFYESGQLLHRGYYIKGQLKVYKNYYPNGKLERHFVNVDNFRSKVSLYYSTGIIKSEVEYSEGAPKVWSDFHENGKMEYHEEYHKSMLYHKEKTSYYDNGQISSQLLLTHKKKLTYTQNDFYKSGAKKMEGHVIFDKNQYDYYKTGTWIYYNESGTPIKEETYKGGKMTNTKTL